MCPIKAADLGGKLAMYLVPTKAFEGHNIAATPPKAWSGNDVIQVQYSCRMQKVYAMDDLLLYIILVEHKI